MEELPEPMSTKSAPQIDLKFCLINAENLFLLFDGDAHPDPLKLTEAEWQKLSTSVYENKSLRKSQALARSLLEINADIIMLCEVGGLESLKNFNQLFLGGAYSPCLLEGNSDRNIDVGFMVRKSLNFYLIFSIPMNAILWRTDIR
jgi:hypothetical protein